MLELTGEQCPLLFGKWKPERFTDFYCDEDQRIYTDPRPRLSQKWDFPFAIVSVESSDIYHPNHHISVHGMTTPGTFNADELFEPRVLEMFFDGRDYMAEKLRKASLAHESLKLVDIKDHSLFGRTTGFHITVEYEKLPKGFDDIEGRNSIAGDIYLSLEDQLDRHFGIKKEELEPSYILWVEAGDAKVLTLGKGTFFYTENPLPDEVNAGTMYMRVISDEHGEKRLHAEIVEFAKKYLETFRDRLHSAGESCVYHGLSGDGSSWRIDLSSLKFPKRLPAQSFFAGMLGSGEENSNNRIFSGL